MKLLLIYLFLLNYLVIGMANLVYNFLYTGDVQYISVPANMTRMVVDLYGAQGGGNGGLGGRLKTSWDVHSGDQFFIFVGGQGDQPLNYQCMNGGFNGGGGTCTYGWTGGGATDVRQSLSDLSSRLAVAGGGGGSSGYCAMQPGAGGGLIGQSADGGATGGNQTHGGIPQYCPGNNQGQPGIFGGGGYGGVDAYNGGGGGGWFGGAGGSCRCGPGAGGSSYSINATALNLQGVRSGNGMAIITFSVSRTTITPTIRATVPTFFITIKPTFDASKAFYYTGSFQTYVVPSNVYRLKIQAYGAKGGSYNCDGGSGGYIEAIIMITPGITLYVNVGGRGNSNGYCNNSPGDGGSAGGYNGGGTGVCGGGAGGGASDVRFSHSLYGRIVIAGGGGGGAYGCGGGAGGGLIGGSGGSGTGGTQFWGGRRRSGSGLPPATNGTLGIGGSATNCGSYCCGTAGGGGGGLWGGGGGICDCSGGGGSSYCNTSFSCQIIQNLQGVKTGDGLVVITPYNSVTPTYQPSKQPFILPSKQPTSQPSRKPSVQPSSQPSIEPSSVPSIYPSEQPITIPTIQPSIKPSKQPTKQPNSHPTSQPFVQPTCKPHSIQTNQPIKTTMITTSSPKSVDNLSNSPSKGSNKKNIERKRYRRGRNNIRYKKNRNIAIKADLNFELK